MRSNNRRNSSHLSSVMLICCGLACASGHRAHAAGADDLARRILIEKATPGGLIVHLGCGNGELITALGADESLLVQGLDTDPANIQKVRAACRSQGLGSRVTATELAGRQLPYVDNLVNLLVAEDLGNVTITEVMRVLRPGGTAYIKEGSSWSTTTKPWPDEIDEWTHFLHGPDNNAVSHDQIVGPPRCLQWVSDPAYGRHHNYLASLSAMVSANGRQFSIEDHAPAASMNMPGEWYLVARDSFNGLPLWNRPIHSWESTKTGFRSGPVQLPRRLIAVGDRVYAALNYGGRLLCLDAATGKTLSEFAGTAGVEEVLCAEGILYLVATAKDAQAGRRILAVATESGDIVWENRDGAVSSILPATLAVGKQRLFFHDAQAVVALDRATGQVAWRRPLPSVPKRPPWSSATIVYRDGVVLCGDRAVEYPDEWAQHPELLAGMRTHGGLGLLTALSAEDGQVLWNCEAAESFHGAVDIFVIDGRVWAAQGPARFFFERTRPILAKQVGEDFYIEKVAGRNLHTGKIEKKIDAQDAYTLIHHHRCYRNKATPRYIIMGRTGVEFIDLTGGASMSHNWTRGTCQYGIMPANGLIYVPPHPCRCWVSAKVSGFFAYSSREQAAWTDAIERCHKATGRPSDGALSPPPLHGANATTDDWPTYRHDNTRSSRAAGTVSDNPTVAWRRNLPGRLSAPTSADGKVFVCAVDHHMAYALNLDDGKELWSYHAGGRIDSPPTFRAGRVYFGSADGYVQCLDADTGALIWRFLAAPVRSSIIARGQLESPWPVAGSVLVKDGFAYVFAGRSAHLDGGMYFTKLNARTGEPEMTKQIYLRDRIGRQDETHVYDAFGPGDMDMAGLLNDIPSSIDSSIFLRGTRLTLDGTLLHDQPLPHLYNPGGFLDDTWWHRYYMVYDARFTRRAVSGRLLVRDGEQIYGYTQTGNRQADGRLFCADISRFEPSSQESTSRNLPRKRRAGGSTVTLWSNAKFPMMVRAMAVAVADDGQQQGSGRLIAAGPPLTAFGRSAALRGAEGGLLGIVDAATGHSLSQTSLDAPPVFDGMCVARGSIVMSLTSGIVVALN
jgi:outer membrane protein assembly factor BamB